MTEVEASPLADAAHPEQYDASGPVPDEVLAPFTGPDGPLAAPLHGHLVAARVPSA